METRHDAVDYKSVDRQPACLIRKGAMNLSYLLCFITGILAVSDVPNAPGAKDETTVAKDAKSVDQAEFRGGGGFGGHMGGGFGHMGGDFGHMGGGFGHMGGGFGRGGLWDMRGIHGRADFLIGRRFGRFWGGQALWFRNWNVDRGMCGRIPRIGGVAALSYEYMPLACGRCVMVRRGGMLQKAVVVDTCVGCGPDKVQISGSFFSTFDRLMSRSVAVDWQFVEC